MRKIHLFFHHRISINRCNSIFLCNPIYKQRIFENRVNRSLKFSKIGLHRIPRNSIDPRLFPIRYAPSLHHKYIILFEIDSFFSTSKVMRNATGFVSSGIAFQCRQKLRLRNAILTDDKRFDTWRRFSRFEKRCSSLFCFLFLFISLHTSDNGGLSLLEF